MSGPAAAPVALGDRLADLAAGRGDRPAITLVGRDGVDTVDFRELYRRAAAAATAFDRRGLGEGDTVAVALPNCLEHYVASWGAWICGAGVVPVRYDLPQWERDRVLAVARPDVVVAPSPSEGAVTVEELESTGAEGSAPAGRVPPWVWAICSGGSTGAPKVIRSPFPGVAIPGAAQGALAAAFGWAPGQNRIVAGPLYHMSGFVAGIPALFDAQHLVVLERFDAGLALRVIETHEVHCGIFVPTMLYRMARHPDFDRADLTGVVAFMSGGAKLAPWLMRAWIDKLGPTRIWEAYGATESHGNAAIRGDEWLAHPGSVGRPFQTDVVVLDPETGDELPPGEVGEIWMRRHGVTAATFEYVGAEARVRPDGFAAVGDLGWVDDEGYLYIADRRTDMIISGGANVYPAEVEAALSEHPAVADVAVIGLPDAEWGQRAHAIVVPADPGDPPDPSELDGYCRARLARYKLAKSYEVVDALPRDEVGKLNRTALVEARVDGALGGRQEVCSERTSRK